VLAGPVSSLIEWVSRPLAWSFVAIVDEATWGPIFDYIAFTRQLEVEFDGRGTSSTATTGGACRSAPGST
jgi:hypothetical protein